MARYSIIEGGFVVNVAVGDAEWAASVGAVQSDEAQIGWTYADGVFTDPTPPPEPAPAPRRAVRKLLIVDRMIAGGFGPAMIAFFEANPVAKLRWDSANDVWADDADLIAALAGMGADPAMILAPE